MAFPDLVKILHLPLDHTDSIGLYAEGQFFADAGSCPVRGTTRFLWYFAVHLFDDDGAHVDSHVWSGPEDDLRSAFLRADSPARRLARRQFHVLLDRLAERVYGDIAIRPFRHEAHGIVFGLIDESVRRDRETFVLYPGGLTFQPPWYGMYDCHHDSQPEHG